MTKFIILTIRQRAELATLFEKQFHVMVKVENIAIADTGHIRITYIDYSKNGGVLKNEIIEP